MANKNKHVIIAYFPSADKAEMAGNRLKDWDKATDEVKLGGTSILAWDGEKVAEHKTGARATGTGAKAGVILGIVAGVLSGGVTLVGGAVAGAVGGSLLGAMKRKGLKLSDEERSTIISELKSGKAALVVMADDAEVEPTRAQLADLGGTVTGFAVPAEAMAEVEKVAEAADSAASTAANDAPQSASA